MGKLEAQRAWIKDMWDKGYIELSKSPWAANLTSAAKKDDQGQPTGELRWCIDYKGVNDETKKDRTPIPLVQESLALLASAKIFSKFDLCRAFNQILLLPESREKTAFICREGLYQCKVMPFS